MSWVVVGVAVVSGALSAKQQSDAAKAQAIELEMAAEREKLSAEAQELARREQLNKALAANVVGLSTSGISGEGTPESIALSSARSASISEGLEGLSSRLKQAQLRRQASTAKAVGKAQAASTLLSSAYKAYQVGG